MMIFREQSDLPEGEYYGFVDIKEQDEGRGDSDVILFILISFYFLIMTE